MYQIKGNNTNVNTNQNGTKQIGTNQNGTNENGTNENGTKQTAAKTCPIPLERCKFCQALLRSTYQVQILLAFFISFHKFSSLNRDKGYIVVDVLWDQPIKLIQVFTSEFHYGLLYVLTSEALQQVKGTKKVKSRSFHQYS